MIYEPTNWNPSCFTGDGNNIIDASVNTTFSVEPHCSGYIYARQFIVRENTPESTLVKEASVHRINGGHAPTYPNGVPNPLTIDVKAEWWPTLSHDINGYEPGYKWQLRLWESDLGVNGDWANAAHYTTHEYLFYAKSAVSLEVDTTGWATVGDYYAPLTGKSKTFHALYTAADASTPSPIQWFRWNVATVTDGKIDDPFYTTGKIYSFQTDFTFEMFVSGYTYAVQVEVYNQDGVYLQSEWIKFAVDYEIISVKGANQSTMLDDGIELKWTGVCYIMGKSIDENEQEVDPGTWGESDYKYGMLKDWPVEGEWALDITEGIRTVFESNENYDVEVDKDGVIVVSVHVPPYTGERINVFRIDYEDGTIDFLDHAGFVAGLAPAGENDETPLVPSATLVPDAGQGGAFIFGGHGNDLVQYVTTEDFENDIHKDFQTHQEENFMVYGATTYEPTTFPTLNPATKVYNIAICKGEFTVVEHDAPVITSAHHYIEPEQSGGDS